MVTLPAPTWRLPTQSALTRLAQFPLGARAVIAVDGRSAVGKTSFAAALAQQWRQSGHRVQVLELDSVYPGWHGLAAGVELAREAVRSWALAGSAQVAQWDWEAHRAGTPRQLLAADRLLVEGVGASLATAGQAQLIVVLQGTPEGRYQRAVQREGSQHPWWWQQWARQEQELFTDHPLPG